MAIHKAQFHRHEPAITIRVLRNVECPAFSGKLTKKQGVLRNHFPFNRSHLRPSRDKYDICLEHWTLWILVLHHSSWRTLSSSQMFPFFSATMWKNSYVQPFFPFYPQSPVLVTFLQPTNNTWHSSNSRCPTSHSKGRLLDSTLLSPAWRGSIPWLASPLPSLVLTSFLGWRWM